MNACSSRSSPGERSRSSTPPAARSVRSAASASVTRAPADERSSPARVMAAPVPTSENPGISCNNPDRDRASPPRSPPASEKLSSAATNESYAAFQSMPSTLCCASKRWVMAASELRTTLSRSPCWLIYKRPATTTPAPRSHGTNPNSVFLPFRVMGPGRCGISRCVSNGWTRTGERSVEMASITGTGSSEALVTEACNSSRTAFEGSNFGFGGTVGTSCCGRLKSSTLRVEGGMSPSLYHL